MALAPAPAAITRDMSASGQVVLGEMARFEQTRQMAAQLGYEGSLSTSAMWDGMAIRMRRSVEETLEAGKIALLLKLQLPHGEFGQQLDARGWNRRVIGRFMQAAAKFHGAGEKLAQLPGMSSTKLLELVVLDDEDVAMLAETGTLPGLPQDAIECMSVSELKAALRERDERIAAKEKVAGQSQKTIQRLQEAIAGKPAPSPEFRAEKALRDLDTEALACAARIETSLRGAIVAVLDADSGVNMALATQGIAAAIGRVMAGVRALADDVGVAITGPNAAPEARDESAGDAAIWDAVNRDMAAKNASSH